MTYEPQTAIHGTLILRFQRPVQFEVRSTSDQRSLVVLLPLPAADAGGASTMAAPAARPVADASPRARIATGARQGATRPARAAGSAGVAVDPEHPYVLNLESALQPLRVEDVPALEVFSGYLLYTTRVKLDGKHWHRLRLGFFPTKRAAAEVQRRVRARYPGAWIDKAPRDERLTALARTAPAGAAPAPATPPSAPALTPEPAPTSPAETLAGDASPTPESALPSISAERLEALMAEARDAMTAGDYSRAIQIYTKVLQYPDHPFRQEAQEFLGLARERNRQLAHAKAEYEEYLRLYPEGPGAQRVRQRLAGLTTARDEPREKLREAKRPKEKALWDVYGGVSQFYRRDESKTDLLGQTVFQSSLASDLDITARRRTSASDIQARFTGGYLKDFLSDGPGDEQRVSTGYIDAVNLRRDASARIGRQSRSTGGVLGRFDGGLFGYRLTSWMKLEATAGFPVDSTTESLQTDRHFYGVNLNLGTFANALDVIPFFIEQTIDGITDRRSVGGELRYFHPNRSLLSLVDYDILFDELNTLLMIGNLSSPSGFSLNASVDYRKSPILMTRNALIGQPVESISELRDLFTDDEIRELARDRTATSRTATLGMSLPLTDKLQLSGDVTAIKLSGTDASGGVEAIPGTGYDYFYSMQLIGSNLLKQGDITILGLRYANAETAKTATATLNSRYPVNRVWRINPRVRFDYRKNDDDTEQVTFAPSLRTTLMVKRRFRFELEGGAEWSTRELSDQTDDSFAWFVNVGYRLDF